MRLWVLSMETFIKIQNLSIPNTYNLKSFKKMNSTIRYIFFVFFILILGTSCGTIKHLKDGETLLRKNKVVIKNKSNVDNYNTLIYELGTQTYQKPNSRFLGLPSLGPWYYYRMQAKKDTTKWTRFVNKNFVEPPAIFSQDAADKSAKSMELMMHKKGYFQAKVDYETKIKGLRKKKTHIKYVIDPGKRYYYDTVAIVSKDTAIQNILNEIKSESFIKKGAPVDEQLYLNEEARITNYLKNHGYANFFRNYIADLDGDSLNFKVNAELQVLLTKDSTAHRTYRIGEVSVISLFDESGNSYLQKDSSYNNIRFYVREGKHYIKLKTLDREIFINNGDVYQVSNIEKTRTQLGNLDVFQFVDIRRVNESPTDSVLNYQIRLIPKKRQEFGYDFELNSSRTASTGSRGFLGTSLGLNYKNRNTFRGGEVFTLQAEGGIEIVPRRRIIRGSEINAWNVNLIGSLAFPKYYDWFKTDRLWTNLAQKKGRSFYQKLKERGVSNASLRYNILFNTGSYRIDVFAGAWGWRLSPSPNFRVTVNKVGIDFLEPVFDPDFEEDFVQTNPYLERSLRSQLFTGFGLLFREIDVAYRKDRRGGTSSFLNRWTFEVSGLEVGAINSLRNRFSDNNITFKLFDKYEFSQYVRLETDLIYYRRFKNNTRMLASRINAGVARRFGTSDEVPFVKQFFVGGPTSMRGWRIRELGPGGYINPNNNLNNNFFQTADFKFEFNLEYRFPLLWYMKGAIFLDMGNIWAFNDIEREDSGFSNFFDEFAIGSGLGFRVDVEYFVFRLDFGYRLRNPYPDDTGSHSLVRSRNDLALNKFRVQWAVGYPF